MIDDRYETAVSRRRFLRYVAAASALPGVSALLAACGGGGAAESRKATTTTAAKKGGILRVSSGSDITGFDPAPHWDPPMFTTSELVYSRLVKADPRDVTRILPDLAVEVPEPQNGTSYTFRLREAKFHDGTPVTADDVKFSIERILDPKTKAAAGYLYAGLFKKIVVVDSRTIRFELVGPRSTFLPLLTLPWGSVLPRHALEGGAKKFNLSPIGSGPFKLDSYRSGQRAVFSRFDEYHAPGSILLDGITLELPVDPETAMLRIDRGELDAMLDDVPPGAYASVRNDPSRKNRLISAVVDNVDYITLNAVDGSPIFRHEDARRGIAMAIDKERLVRQLQGRARAATGFWSPASQYWDEDYKGIPHDPEQARQLIEKAGVKGMSVDFIGIAKGSFYPLDQIGPSIVQDLEAAGLRANLKSLEFSNWLSHTMEAGAIVPNGWPMDDPHGSYVVDSSFTSATRKAAEKSGSCCNFSRFSDPEVDRLAKIGVTTTDKAEEIRAYQEILRTVVDRALWIPLFYPRRVVYKSDRVQNLTVPTNWEGLLLSEVGLAS